MAKETWKNAANTAVQPSEETKKAAKNLNPIDELFFKKMAEDAATCEEVISTILETKVKVLSLTPDATASLQELGIGPPRLLEIVPEMRVQVELLEDSPIGKEGTKVIVDVQKAIDYDNQRKARFNAEAITMNAALKGLDIPDVVEIFICPYDMFKQGELTYHIDRVIQGSGRVLHNGVTEIYVSATLEDRSTPALSAISDLMKLFMEPNAYDYEQFPKFSERKRQFKETEEGIRIMSEELQKLIDKEAQEAM